MPVCNIKCPYCEIDFNHDIDDESSDLYETNYIECCFCNQTIEVNFKLIVNADIVVEPDPDELKEMQEAGKKIRDESFVIKFKRSNAYLSYDDKITDHLKEAKKFFYEYMANNKLKTLLTNDVSVIKYKDCI